LNLHKTSSEAEQTRYIRSCIFNT